MSRYTLEELQETCNQSRNTNASDFIYFWRPDEREGKEACFCQWFKSYFVVDGIRYNCAEQFMMAEKARLFGDMATRGKILRSTDPSEMKHLGRKVKGFVPEVWDRISSAVVVRGNVAKFRQDLWLTFILLGTENKIIVEASPYDQIWGIGMTAEDARKTNPYLWRGKNKLGFALMEVRDIIRKEADRAYYDSPAPLDQETFDITKRGFVLLKSSYVAGIKFVEDKEVLQNLREYQEVRLVRECDNEYDENAVAIYCGRTPIGFVPRTENKELAAMLEAGWNGCLHTYLTEVKHTNEHHSIKFSIFLESGRRVSY